ncbi:MAG: lactonase family protein, partial [Bryobacteraceae bacterium]
NSGTLIPNSVATAAPGAGARHLAFFPDGRFVFVLNELDNTVGSFAYDADRGILTRIQTISTLPTGWIGRNTTAQVVVSADGRFLYASNRNFNSIALFTINAATGELAIVDQEFTQGETPRNFNLDPAGNFLYVANMNSDNIVVYRVDSNTGKLTPTGDVYAAGQPSSIVFNPPPASGNSARAGVTFWANPNPIYAGAGGLGQTTLSWNAPGTRLVEIHIGSPNGPNVGSQPAYGTTTTFRWVNNGMTFYLQDVSDGKALTAENTLATVRAVVR